MKRIVFVGDLGSGKTSLICSILGLNQWMTNHRLTAFFDYKVMVNGKQEKLELVDTSGNRRFHELSLDQFCRVANAILIFYPVNSRGQFENIRTFWVPEILKRSTTVPYIILGTKIDLRSDSKTKEELEAVGQSFVTKEEGKALADEVKAIAYLECSTLQYEDARYVFRTVFRIMGVEPVVETNTSSEKTINTREKKCTVL